MADIHRVGTISVAFESASRLLTNRADEVLTGKAAGSPPVMTTRILGTLVSREVLVEAGPPVAVDKPIRSVAVAFTIQAAERPDWFPVFSGDLELTATAEQGVELALEGRYSVPGGFVGRLADKGGLHRIADDSIDRFFNSILDRIRRGSGSFDALMGVPHA